MSRKTVSGIMLIFILISTLTLAFSIQPVKGQPKTWTVDDDGPADFHTIKEAINAASDGDSIFVYSGTYYEHPIINKSISLIGENKATTCIDGSGNGTVVTMTDKVNIRGFTIQRGGSGIYIEGTGNTVVDNVFRYIDGGASVFLERGSKSNIISNNRIIGTGSWGAGILLFVSRCNTIKDNLVTSLDGIGIFLSGCYFDAYNIVEDNFIKYSEKGILLQTCYAGGNIVRRNNLYRNQLGIRVTESYGNNIYHNSIVENSNQVFNRESSNTWDDGYPSGGNYWSDFEERYPDARERNGSGIWDTSYEIDENNRDNHPLMHPYGSIRNLDTNLTYLTLQSAIDAPETLDGHTIFVKEGTYYEQVILDKSISLIGENRRNTIIDGDSNGNVIEVTANSVNITSLTIQNGIYPWNGIILYYSNNNRLIGNNVSNNYIGIALEYSSNNMLVDNTASYNVAGIKLLHSSNNMLVDNTVSRNRHGIDLAASSGNILSNNTMVTNSYNFGCTNAFNNTVYLNNTADGKPIYYVKGVSNVVYDLSTNAATIYVINSVNVTVKDLKLSNNPKGIHFWNTSNSRIENVVTSENQFGIWLERSSDNVLVSNIASNNNIGIHFSYQSNNNRLVNNSIASNLWGIHFYQSNNNTLVSNIVSNNKKGIELDYSTNNIVYHNNFIDNIGQVVSIDSINIWDDGYPSGGNYWSDQYHGDCADHCNGPGQDIPGSDAIVDTPYVIDESNQDRYPLMNPWIPPGLFADLIQRKAWPEHHHYDISKDEDEDQTLYAEVKNLGNETVWVKVLFNITKEDGSSATIESELMLIETEATVDLSASFGPLTDEDIGKYSVSTTCLYSHNKIVWAQGKKTKTFKFNILP